MDALEHCRLMARYNRWFNERLYECASRLDPDALAAPRGAFFGSILGTLNHLAVADSIWLRRFANAPTGPDRQAADATDPQAAGSGALRAALRWLPQPARLDETLHDRLEPLAQLRARLDAVILQWVGELAPADLDATLAYRNMRGDAQAKPLGALLSHFFNHQTHHRGQVTTLLSQAGIDPGVTDLLAVIPDLGSGQR